MHSRTGTVKPRHTPLANSVSYDNAVNSTQSRIWVLGGAGAGLLRSYGKGLFTSVFCVSVLLLGQLSVCNSRVKLSGISTSNYVSI